MKRGRSDTASAGVTAAQNAALEPLEPPAHVKLRDGDLPFWNSIVRARARDTWNDVDLENAANLCRCKADIERLSEEIKIEGDIIENERGTKVINQKHTLLEILSRRAVALSRMLHVHAEATVGKSEDASKTLKTQNKAKDANDQVEDELIPKLRAVK